MTPTIDRPATAAVVDQITILVSHSRDRKKQGKRLLVNGDRFEKIKQDHPMPLQWQAVRVPFSSLKQLGAILKKAAQDGDKIIVHGTPKADANATAIYRRREQFDDVKHRFVIIDIDGFKSESPEGAFVAVAIRAQLPEEFRKAACVFQLTRSHWTTPGEARARLIFLTDREISGPESEAFLSSCRLNVDASIYRTVQPIFLGIHPEGGPDPFAERWGLLTGAEFVSVPDNIESEEIARVNRGLPAPANVVANEPHMFAAALDCIARRDPGDMIGTDGKLGKGRRMTMFNMALDCWDYAISEDLAEAAITALFSNDADSLENLCENLAAEGFSEPDVAKAADRIVHLAERNSEAFATGEPLDTSHVLKMVGDAYHGAQNAFGCKFETLEQWRKHAPPDGEAFGFVFDEDADTGETIEFIRERLANSEAPGPDVLEHLQRRLAADGLSASDVLVFRMAVEALTPDDFALDDQRADILDRLSLAAQKARAKQKQAQPSTAKPLFILADDLARNFAPMEYSVRGLLPRRGIGFFNGPSQGGKSFTVIDLGGHVATGKDWLGYKIKQKYCVLYVTGEGREGIDQRVKAWTLKHGDFAGNFAVMPDPPNLYSDPKAVEKIVAAAKALAGMTGVECALIILDTVASLCAGMEESSAKEVGELTYKMRQIAAKADAAVMGVHHTGLGDKTRGRGSSALYANADFELLIKVTPDDPTKPVQTRTLFNTKNRDHARNEGGHPFTLEKVQVGEFADDKEPIFSRVFTPQEPTEAFGQADEDEDAPGLGPVEDEPAGLSPRHARVMEAARTLGERFTRDDLLIAHNERFGQVDRLSEDMLKRTMTALQGDKLELHKEEGNRAKWFWTVKEQDEAD